MSNDESTGPFTKDQVIAASTTYFKGKELPASVFADKYALRDRDGVFYESTPDDMHHRMAREFARIEQKYANPLSEAFIYSLFKDFSRVCPQGSPMFGIGNNFVAVSTSNCAVIDGPEDTMSSIFDTARNMANLYKRRFGVGTDLSKLRPAGASVRNAAMTSTGAWSFADFYSYVTRMVGQSGRRGALMLTMDVRHPDIERFITMKADPTKVTGANVSVRVSDSFMQAVVNNTVMPTYFLHWPIGSRMDEWKSSRLVSANDIFKLIAKQACATAEPGLLFWDTIKANLPLDFYPGFETLSTNPCGEVPLSKDACRLISIYLPAFIRDEFTLDARFDWAEFSRVVEVGQRLADDLVDLELEKLHAIRDSADTEDEKAMFTAFIETCEKGRRTGLGTHGLADALARLRIRYDSDEGIDMAKEIYEEFAVAAYESSVTMARERGAFPMFDWSIECECEFFSRLPGDLVAEMAQVGRRNGALLTNAPTGSVSILSDNCSSGIEPVFANSYTRRRKVDHEDPYSFADSNGDHWIEFEVFHPNVERWMRGAYDGTLPTFAMNKAGFQWLPLAGRFEEDTGRATFEYFARRVVLPDYFVTSDMIDPMQRIAMQAAITQSIDHSVSSTINLPAGTTPEEIEEIYMAAWTSGCKGITVYVDGAREGQVLTALPVVDDDDMDAPISDLESDLYVCSMELGTALSTVSTLTKEVASLTQQLENERTIPALDLDASDAFFDSAREMYDASALALAVRAFETGRLADVRGLKLSDEEKDFVVTVLYPAMNVVSGFGTDTQVNDMRRAFNEAGLPFDPRWVAKLQSLNGVLTADNADLIAMNEGLEATLFETTEKLRTATEHARPKTRRGVETFGAMFKADFRNIDGVPRKVYVYVGVNEHGDPVEVFVTDAKGDEDFKPYAAAIGKLVSLLLKFGVPCRDIEETLVGLKGSSISYTGAIFHSVPDLVGKRLRTVREAEDVKHDISAALAEINEGISNFAVVNHTVESAIRLHGIKGTATATVTEEAPATTGKLTGMRTFITGSECPACGDMNMRRQEGCMVCPNCGWSKCS